MISGGDFYKNIDLCYQDLENLTNYVQKQVPNLQKQGPDKSLHHADPMKKSSVTTTSFFDKKYVVHISCYDWPKKY